MEAIIESATNTAGNGSHPTFVIVDASNVAFAGARGDGKPRLRPLCYLMDELLRASVPNVVIADASLRYRIDDKPAYDALVRGRFILQAPAGIPADRYMILLAQKRKAEGERVLILTDDRLLDQDVSSLKRMTFMVIGDEEILLDPPLDTLRLREADSDTAQPSPPVSSAF